MKHSNRLLLFLGFALFAIVFIFSENDTKAAPLHQTTHQVYVSNVHEGGFTVSWTTDEATDGSVDFGTSSSLGNTATDPINDTTTHYVEINGLTPDTAYVFQIRSGSTIDNNDELYYSVRTGTVLGGTPGSYNLWGYVRDHNNNLVPNAIVYLQLQDADGEPSPGVSAWATARTNESGEWGYNLLNIRSSDGTSRFAFNGGTDNIRIIWQGGSLGVIGETGNEDIRAIPNNNAILSINLDNNPTVISLNEFSAIGNHNSLLWVGLILIAVLIFTGFYRFLLKHRK